MTRPSLILVHGAATGAWVWHHWRTYLFGLGWDVNVLDLRGHGRSLPTDLATVTMEDYLADLESVTYQIEAVRGAHPIVGGWGMGGTIAMMYAAKHPETSALLLLEPSPPLEVSGRVAPAVVREFSGAVIRPENLGIYTDDLIRSRDVLFDLSDEEAADFLAHSVGAEESGLAFRQTLRGISIPHGAVSPTLVVYGETEARSKAAQQNRQLSLYLGCESLAVPGAGHWGVVYSDAVVSATALKVDAWLQRTLP